MPRKKTQKAVEAVEETELETSQKNPRPGKFILLVLTIIIVGFLIWRNKSLFVVAFVDNKPIWRPTFETRVLKQVGQKTLDDMVNEQIILNEGAKRGTSISAKDVDSKILEIEKTLPKGTTLESALSSQGMTMDDLRRQLTLQLTIEKMLTTSQVTDAEIKDYVEKNKQFITATDEAQIKLEARQALINQKKSTNFQKLFEDLKKNAKVVKFL